VIVADTGAIVALIDRSDRHHEAVLAVYEANPAGVRLPWAILPEVDYLLATHVGPKAQLAFLADLAEESFAIEWERGGDLRRAEEINRRYAGLRLGLVDAVVMAVAERLRADVLTLDVRHFRAVRLAHSPNVLPR
jgi:uncharacterized protein